MLFFVNCPLRKNRVRQAPTNVMFTRIVLIFCLLRFCNFTDALRSVKPGAQLNCGRHEECPPLTHNEYFWEIKSSTPLCCEKKGVTACCTIFDILKSRTTVYSSTTVEPPDQKNTNSHTLSIVSFGIGATVGVIIGILLLFIGCGVAFHYCCSMPNPGYQPPVITYRQSGLRGRNSHVVSIPLDPDQRGSHFSITISGQGLPTVNYRSQSPETIIPEEPPKYEDVPNVSFPVYKEMQSADQELPSYSAVVSSK